jgi:4-hydroxy-tetrahydrodipicolinate synthase
MVHPLFRGAFTALITPFRDGQVDEEAFVRLVRRQIDAGIHGLVPVGTTGESVTLTADEHRRVVDLCVETAAGKTPVIAGAGSNNTAEAIELVRHAKAAGADAALVVTPYYNRPSQEGLYRHYAAINEAVELPLLIYNVPSRTSVDISNDTLERLSKLANVIGIKDATSDLGRASLQRLHCGPDWVMLSGNDDSALGYMAHGGHGCITVTGNVAPKLVAAFYEACLQGDWDGALKRNDQLIHLHKALFADASPAPTKFAMARLGVCNEEFRLPLSPCRETAKPQILEALKIAGLL